MNFFLEGHKSSQVPFLERYKSSQVPFLEGYKSSHFPFLEGYKSKKSKFLFFRFCFTDKMIRNRKFSKTISFAKYLKGAHVYYNPFHYEIYNRGIL